MAINILRAFDNEPPPLDFVLPGLLAGTVGALVSPGGTGKSMLAIELAILVASGLDIAGIAGEDTTMGNVVYLAAEDPDIAIQHRLYAIGKYIKSKNANEHIDDIQMDIARSLTIEPLIGHQPDIFRPDWFDFIKSHAVNKRLIFLDTLRRFHTLDENDSGAMAEMLGRLEAITTATGCAIVFLHHASKAAALNGQGDMQQASRGSSVLVDNVRWQMYLAGMSKEEAKKNEVDEEMRGYWVKCGISKQNYGQPTAEKWLRRVEGGVLTPGHLGQNSNLSKKSIKPTNDKKDW